MQTPAILNTANVTPAAKSGASPIDGAGSNSFQNMLSQQVAERQPCKPAENKPATPASNQQTARPADSSAPDNAPPAKADSAQDAKAKPADDADQTTSAKGKDAKDDQAAADAAAALPPTATELIAQALNINVRNDAATADAKGKPTDALAGAAQTPFTRARQLAAGEVSLKPDAAADSKSVQADHAAKAGVDKNAATDFSAAMKQGSEQLHAASAAAAEAQVTQTAARAAALQSEDHGLQATTTVTANPAQVQQAGFDLAQAVNGQAERLTPRVGTPAWDQALGQKVVWMVGGAQQSASLTLNPPDLGPLQVVLNVHNGQADASFYAAQPEVRQALEAALPKLRDMMSDSGIQLGQTSVNAGTPDQFNQQANPSSAQAARNAGRGNGNDGADAAPQTVRTQTIRGGQGLVDTFV